jgi:hypothetical protein
VPHGNSSEWRVSASRDQAEASPVRREEKDYGENVRGGSDSVIQQCLLNVRIPAWGREWLQGHVLGVTADVESGQTRSSNDVPPHDRFDPHKRTYPGHVVMSQTCDCVAKLFAALRNSNYRIQLSLVLNRCCAPVLALESILLNSVVKIVLQHNLPKPALSNRSRRANQHEELSRHRSTIAELSSVFMSTRPKKSPSHVRCNRH